MSRPSRRQVVLALLLTTSVAFLGYTVRGRQPTGALPGAGRARERTTTGERELAERRLPLTAPADVDFRRYAALGSSDIFSETRGMPLPPMPKSPPRPVPPFPQQPPEPVQRGPDLSGWSYVGYVTLDGERLGILQNDSTQASRYLAVGDDFLGVTVQDIDRESIRLGSGASGTTLSRPRDFPVMPLAPQSKGPGGGPAPGPVVSTPPGQPGR